MATRPAWCVENGKIRRENYNFTFNPGFSITQKKKNIVALHESIGKKALEISTKSDDSIGISLSAFNLKLNGFQFENVFQSSKKYSSGGPYLDLLTVSPKDAKRDERHRTSGKLIGFVYDGKDFPIEPKTFFYDYMYIQAVQQSISKEKIPMILEYEYFTDIEFNPNKSINCQAKSVAILKAILEYFGDIPALNIKDFESFYKMVAASKA